MELKNYTETVVEQVLEDIIKNEHKKMCTCEKCKLDVMARALNNLPSHYYVSEKGEVYSKLASTYVDFRTRVVTEITKAMMYVEKEPRH